MILASRVIGQNEYANSEAALFFLSLIEIQLLSSIIDVIPTVSNRGECVRREASKAEAKAEASADMIEPESSSTMNANVIGSSSFNEESAAGEGETIAKVLKNRYHPKIIIEVRKLLISKKMMILLTL